MIDPFRAKGGYIPVRPTTVRLKDGERIWAKENNKWVEYEHQVDNHGKNWRLVKTGTTRAAVPGHTGLGLTADEYLELEKRRQENMKLAANYIRKKYGRKQIVKIRKERDGVFRDLWKWECQQCARTYGASKIWEYVLHDAYTHAIMKHALPDHHARNHHGDER